MTKMGYDAIGLGNNEFDDGPQELASFVREMGKSGVPVLGTNVDTSREPRFNGILLPKSHVLTISGVRVAILSVVTRQTAAISKPGGIRILPEADSINRETWRLKQQGVKIFILVSHVGFDFDQRLALLCPDIDVIVGGHSQTFLYSGTPPTHEDRKRVEGSYPFIVRRRGRASCVIVQDYRYGKYLGKLQILFNRQGDVTHWRGQPILLDQTVGQDQNIIRSLAPLKRILEDALKKCVGSTKVLLEASDKVCRFRECNMGNLMADAFLDYYASRKSTLRHAWSDVNAAIIHGGMAKESIRQNSNVTLHDVQRAMPNDHQLVLMKMTGSQLYKMFEHAVSNFTWFPYLEGKFLQVAGMRVTYDLGRKSGWRTVWLKILCANCSVPRYEDVHPSKTYTIVTTSFIANGGEGFKFDKGVLKHGDGVGAFYVFTKYFTKLSPIKTAEEGRIVVKNLPPRRKPISPGQSPSPGFVPPSPRIPVPVPSRPPATPLPPTQQQFPVPVPSRPLATPLQPPQQQFPMPVPGQQPTTPLAPNQPQITLPVPAQQSTAPLAPGPPQITLPVPGGAPNLPFAPGQSQTTLSGPGQPSFPVSVPSQSPISGPVQGQASSTGFPSGQPTSTGFASGHPTNSGMGQSLATSPGYGQGQLPSTVVGPVQPTSAGFGQAQFPSPGTIPAPSGGYGAGPLPSAGQVQAPSSGFGQGTSPGTGFPPSQSQNPGFGQVQQPSSVLMTAQAPNTAFGQSQPQQTAYPQDTSQAGWSSS